VKSARCSASYIAGAMLGALIALTACGERGSSDVDAAREPIALGTWRGTLALPGGEAPFGFEIAREAGAYVIYLKNGAERVRVREVNVQNGALTANMPGFAHRLEARIDEGRLHGSLTMVKREGKEQAIPFAATQGASYRFFPKPTTDNADVSGRWKVTFTDDKRKPTPAVAEFRQSGSEVTGTFPAPTGDHRFLAGEMRGDELFLSTFDGGHAYLYRARVLTNGELAGTYWSGLAWQESFVATRDAEASLGDAARVTAMRAGATRLEFTFPDLDGKRISLADPQFAGKVVVVALAGSWCPNCHDEAAFLAPWYLRNRDRGLEVVSLMFEQFGDFSRAAAATRRFRDAFGIEYTTLIAGVSDKDDAATRLPQLNGVFAFPTTLFLDRRGTVRFIHTGFSGPATGAHHRTLIEEFEANLEQLIAERPVT